MGNAHPQHPIHDLPDPPHGRPTNRLVRRTSLYFTVPPLPRRRKIDLIIDLDRGSCFGSHRPATDWHVIRSQHLQVWSKKSVYRDQYGVDCPWVYWDGED